MVTLSATIPSHFPCGSVDWNVIHICANQIARVTSLAEVWIGISVTLFCLLLLFRHFPCGSVDWNNPCSNSTLVIISVTSLAEVWIEIPSLCKRTTSNRVTSLAEVWIEILKVWATLQERIVTSLAEVWIEINSFPKSTTSRLCHFPCGSVDWNN